jgi:hypothetical protein
MKTALKVVHYAALSAFLGSIFTHILLGAAFGGGDLAKVALVLQIKETITSLLIFSGLAIAVLSGAGLIAFAAWRPRIKPWLGVKLVLVGAVIANASLELGPIGAERARLAASAAAGGPALGETFRTLGAHESIFGAVNLLLVLLIIAISVRRVLPFAKRTHSAPTLGRETAKSV